MNAIFSILSPDYKENPLILQVYLISFFIQFLAGKGKVYNMKYGEIGTFISLRLHKYCYRIFSTVNCFYCFIVVIVC
jgi:hypothetical protein